MTNKYIDTCSGGLCAYGTPAISHTLLAIYKIFILGSKSLGTNSLDPLAAVTIMEDGTNGNHASNALH